MLLDLTSDSCHPLYEVRMITIRLSYKHRPRLQRKYVRKGENKRRKNGRLVRKKLCKPNVSEGSWEVAFAKLITGVGTEEIPKGSVANGVGIEMIVTLIAIIPVETENGGAKMMDVPKGDIDIETEIVVGLGLGLKIDIRVGGQDEIEVEVLDVAHIPPRNVIQDGGGIVRRTEVLGLGHHIAPLVGTTVVGQDLEKMNHQPVIGTGNDPPSGLKPQKPQRMHEKKYLLPLNLHSPDRTLRVWWTLKVMWYRASNCFATVSDSK